MSDSLSDSSDTERGEEEGASSKTIPVSPPGSESSESGVSGFSGQMKVIDDRYEVKSLLGQGSTGNVFRVHDRELDEDLALKSLLRTFVEDERAVEQFRREVKLARRVTHRNVARTYEFGIDGDLPYMTLELIEGESLDRIIDEDGPLGNEAFSMFVRPVCEALEAIHEIGIIHRDLKPQNIMMTMDGRVVVTDFGVARRVHAREDKAFAEERIVGTPAYMAPEQVDGRHGLGPPTDIYAFGLIMYEMLTGDLPWNDEEGVAAVAYARCIGDAPELPEEGPWPKRYRDVVERCLRRDPEERFDSALEIVEALESERDVQFETFDFERPSSESRERSVAVGVKPGPYVKTVAVLQFSYGGPDEGAYLADGLADEVADELSRVEELAVLPRGAAGGIDRDADPRAIGRSLGVEVVVEGAVRRIGGSLRARVAVTSVEEGFQLWGENYNTEAAELLDVGQEAGEAIKRALTVATEERGGGAPSDPVAIDLYMRGRHLMQEHWHKDVSDAIALFEDALEREPEDPRILSALATAQARRGFIDSPNRDRHVRSAKESAHRAIEVAPNWPEPYVALAMARFNAVEFGPALDALSDALQRDTDSPEAHELKGRILAEIGSLRAAEAHLCRALKLNPHLYYGRWDLARVYALQGEWENVDDWLEREVNSETARDMRYANRARFDLWREEPRWADDPTESRGSSNSVARRMAELMKSIARGEDFDDEKRKHFADFLQHHGEDSRFLSFHYQLRVDIGAHVGETDYALENLQNASEAGLVDVNWLDYCPILDDLRGRPEFEEVYEVVEERVSQIFEG